MRYNEYLGFREFFNQKIDVNVLKKENEPWHKFLNFVKVKKLESNNIRALGNADNINR